MNINEWAEKEVEIACKREREANGTPDGDWDYGAACYESALKAYKALADDDHSGYSWNITRNILIRLMDGKPLTPIEDTEDTWNLVNDIESGGTCAKYQCRRMSGLFKDVYPDGRVEYSDVDRVVCYNLDNPNVPYYNGLSRRIIDEMFPITMPYYPMHKPYRVWEQDLLTDRKNGDFDTKHIVSVTTPTENVVEINRYFKETEDGWKEIDEEEYHDRYVMHSERILREKIYEEANEE